ncbi:hypothetical protein O6H91_14G012700 [Diphasiastrum complanatum]|uniref:Uncharacterized protein n=1 Tax=Diphasiastrum complanatum TaxID=34168 RepID=A0ACC2BLM4_DIPCM|nr:hypothetical protein O6H91_14G012700 [Diphasiastrum complanatum]
MEAQPITTDSYVLPGCWMLLLCWHSMLKLHATFCYLLLLLSLFGLACSDFPFIEDATQSRLKSEYDYIIVGGGTAGCPLAATLSQKFRVLVLERGGIPYGNPNIERIERFEQNLAEVNDSAPAQEFISEDGVMNHRARVLGGGTCLNAGFYSRCSDEYARRAGWDLALVKESFLWVEERVVFVPVLRQWQAAVRAGLLESGVLPDRGVTFDHLIGTKTSGSIFDQQGHRHTAADLLRAANFSNIAVLVHATVSRILFAGSCGGLPGCKPRAFGVIYSDRQGIDHLALLSSGPSNEVILSAGALGSPQLLLLSGIGPAQDLASFGIPEVLDLEEVGKGMADNPTNAVVVPSPRPVELALLQIVGITDFGSFIETGSAPASVLAGGLLAGTTVPPMNRSRALTDQIMSQLRAIQNTAPSLSSQIGFILEKVIGPLSNGDLRLNTTDIRDNPLVRFNYFSQPQDLDRCIRGMRAIERVINSPAMATFTFRRVADIPEPLMNAVRLIGNMLPSNTADSDAVARFCRDTVMTIWHYHGGCQMGRVVDKDYRVFGVDALRVVDGSTYEFTPGTNPQATTMMLGRYMGIQILRERLQSEPKV